MMRNIKSLFRASAIALFGLMIVTSHAAHAGAYIFAGEINGIDIVTHPTGYTGTGGTVTVSVCIDPASPNASDMETPVRNIVDTFNALTPIDGNLVLPSPTLTGSQFDFESTALHEVGHCIGLAHPNLATESGTSGSDRDYTKTTDGVNDGDSQNTPDFNLGSGTDGIKGSSDDVRGNDVNLHWYRISNNNPFTIATTVDSTTYARDTSSLPGGHTFAANADRSVGTSLGVSDTEAVMQQGTFSDEEQRHLNHDDVATLMYARTGLDSLTGTADDYTVTLTYAGLTSGCDVVIDFDNTETGFAVCKTSGIFLPGGHVQITGADIFFNTGFDWFFNSTLSQIFTDGFESGNTSSWASTVTR